MPRAPRKKHRKSTVELRYVGPIAKMLDQLGKKKCDLILRSGSLELIAKDPVVVNEK